MGFYEIRSIFVTYREVFTKLTSNTSCGSKLYLNEATTMSLFFFLAKNVLISLQVVVSCAL